MRIIKQGKKPEELKYKCECETCHTIFEFIRKEAKYFSDKRDGDYLQISCPVCYRYCYVQANRTSNE